MTTMVERDVTGRSATADGDSMPPINPATGVDVDQLPAKAHHTAFAVVPFTRDVGGLAVQKVEPRRPVRQPRDCRGAGACQESVSDLCRPPPAPFTRDPPSILTTAIGAPGSYANTAIVRLGVQISSYNLPAVSRMLVQTRRRDLLNGA